jgi:HAD superfamily hydrolase (TIGR01457 family)
MLADHYGCILLDLDGVLYRGDEAVPQAPPTMVELRRRGVRPVFLTNNSSRTPRQVADRLRAIGIEADPAEVVTSALATAELLAKRGGGRAFVIGQDGVREALTDAGIQVLEGEPEEADLVVVGFDGGATYGSLKRASLLVQRGARLIATNADGSYPAADGLWPGAGALLSVITTTTGAEPEIVGKPFPPLFEAGRRRGGGGKPLVVGDRLDTDIEGAARLGWDTMLVLTGVSRREDVERTGIRVTVIAEDVSALLEDPGAAGGPGAILGRGAGRGAHETEHPRSNNEGVIEMAVGLEQVRQYMEAAIGKLSPAKAQELAKSLTKSKSQGRDQVSKAAKDLLAWSNKNKERLTSMVQTEVKSQLKTIGVASRDEVDALRKRVRELERDQGKKSTRKRSTAKRSTAKRSTAKPATSSPPSEPA